MEDNISSFGQPVGLEKYLPRDSGVPLMHVRDRSRQFHSDNRRFGGVEVVTADQLEPRGRQDPEKAARMRDAWGANADLVGQTMIIHLEEGNMGATQRKAVIKSRLEALEAELVELEQFGEDEFDENTVLVFDMKFPNSDVIFTYAAIKKEKVWFITGVANGQYRSWDQLVNFWKDKVVSIHKVKDYEELYTREDVKAKALEGDVLLPSTHNPETGEKKIADADYDGPKV